MLSKLFFAFILLLSTAVYAQQSQGKVYAEDKPLEGVLIINKTQDLMTSTNRWGTFEIAAQLGDSLIFSYSFFETQIHKVEAYQLEETWVVELKESRNELDAVTITATNKVKEFRVEEYDKNFNTWLQKDIQEHPELYSPGPSGSGIDFIAIGKMVWNSIKKDKKEKAEDPNRFRILKLGELEAFFKKDAFFNQDLLRNQLAVTQEEEPLFFDYCLEQQVDARLLQDKNEMRFLEYLMKRSAEFHKLNAAN